MLFVRYVREAFHDIYIRLWIFQVQNVFNLNTYLMQNNVSKQPIPKKLGTLLKIKVKLWNYVFHGYGKYTRSYHL